MDLHLYRNAQDRWHDLKTASTERGAVLAVNAVTLGELIEKITPDARLATLGQRLAVLRRVRGTHTRYALDAINELKAAGVHRSQAPMRPELHELLDGYQQGLRKEGLVDPVDRCWLAASRVAEGPSPWLKRFERVVLHAIYDLNDAEFALVRNLIEILPDGGTIVLFNATTNVKPTQFAEWTWQRFVNDESLAERTFPEFCRAAGPNAGILERLFAFDTADLPLEPTTSLRIVQAAGRYREVERIGSEIADLLARGENAGEVAVVVRHIETYGEMIEDVFSRYGIPHQFETGVPLLRVPFIKYWFALLDLVTSDRERASLARVMSSAYFDPRLSPGTDVEKELTVFGYIDRRHLRASDLARRRNSSLTSHFERMESFLDRLETTTATIPGFLSRLQPACVLTVRDRQAWSSLAEELESVVGLMGAVTFPEFRAIAGEVASMRTVDRLSRTAVAPGIAGVRIMSPRSLGSRDYRWIFAPGLNDGEFPFRSPANPLLPDELILDINKTVWPRRLHTTRDRNRREPLYLFMTLDSARESVMLTYPANTLEGDPLVPSVYIGEIARHFSSDPIERSPQMLPAREAGESSRRIADAWRQGSIEDSAATELLGSDVVARVKLERRGANRADLGRDAVGCVPSRAWHPSELNALAECPFTFLAKYRLKLRTTEPPDFEIPPTEIGKLAHDILREFYTTAVPPDERQAMERMDAIIRRRLADADVSGQGPFSVFDPALWKIRRTQLVAALHQYVGFAVRDAFAGYETLTGYLDNPLPPSELGPIVLAGRPDHVAVRRIGERVEAIRVDDFKYSAASSATSKMLRDSFQVPVYAYLAARAVSAELTTQIDGRYLLLRSPSTPVVSHAIDGKLFEELRGRIETLVEKARSGQFHPEPSDRQECSGCNYRRLCRMYGG